MLSLQKLMISFLAVCVLMVGSTLAQSSTDYTGTMGDTVPDSVVDFELAPGQSVTITAEATSGNLDTYLILLDDSGTVLLENDDIAGSLNSRIEFTSEAGGSYTIRLTNIRGTAGRYLMTVTLGAGGSAPTAVPTTAAATPVVVEGIVTIYEGVVRDTTPDGTHDIRLEAGSALIMLVETTSEDLDPVVILRDSAGNELTRNDDRATGDFNSEAYFVASASGTYRVIVANFPGTGGGYRLTLTVTDPSTLNDVARIQLSGPRQTVETEHFIIHYTTEGADAATMEYAAEVGRILEFAYDVQVNQMGWAAPKPDNGIGGDERLDVYLINLVTEDATELGYVMPEEPKGDNPNIPGIQENAVASFMVVDNDYVTEEGPDEITRLLNATLAHELHHMIQFGYTSNLDWLAESTATYMETVTIPPYQDATGYVENNFTYPEVCFGAVGDADATGSNQLKYGTWLFVDSIIRQHGEQVLMNIWGNMMTSEQWAPFELALAGYGDTLPDAVALYHLRNLVRDYDLADQFEGRNTVWLENTIDSTGAWTFKGKGIQELAANYFTVDMPPAVYNFAVAGNNSVVLYAVGISQDKANVYALGSGGTVDTSGYEHVHIVAFNTQYTDTTAICNYVDYEITVSTGSGSLATVAFTLNAEEYLPLR